jgi:predicted transcriptional regulator
MGAKEACMSKIAHTPAPTTLVTIRLPVAMKERFDWMARVMNRPRNYVFVEALQRYLDQEEWQLKDILEALDEAAREEGIPHEEVMQDARAIVERARAAQEARTEGA